MHPVAGCNTKTIKSLDVSTFSHIPYMSRVKFACHQVTCLFRDGHALDQKAFLVDYYARKYCLCNLCSLYKKTVHASLPRRLYSVQSVDATKTAAFYLRNWRINVESIYNNMFLLEISLAGTIIYIFTWQLLILQSSAWLSCRILLCACIVIFMANKMNE